MFYLTKPERLVILSLIFVVFFGTTIDYLHKKYPSMDDLINFMEMDETILAVNVNRAGYEELLALPHIGPYTANLIVNHRREFGDFKSLEEIANLPGIRQKNFTKFSKYLKI